LKKAIKINAKNMKAARDAARHTVVDASSEMGVSVNVITKLQAHNIPPVQYRVYKKVSGYINKYLGSK